MASGRINLQSNDGKVAGIMFEDGASSNVTVTVPKEGGVVATEAYADTKVSKTGNETIAGVKTFSSNTIFNGNVGIGVTPSAWDTNIKAIEQGSRTSLFELNGDTVLNNNAYISTSSQWIRKTANACTMYEQVNGSHYWSNVPSGTAGNPITWTNAMTLDNSGNLLLQSGTGGLGYGTGSGGTVTQLTSKSTAVTLNKPSGRIIMNNTALAAGATAIFGVNNSLITSSDTINVNMNYGYDGDRYDLYVWYVAAGVFYLKLTNISASSLSDALVINFTVIKGATA